jgi:hypothetical protein
MPLLRLFGGPPPLANVRPVDQSSHLELVVNLRSAERLGIRIPRSVLLRTDKVLR